MVIALGPAPAEVEGRKGGLGNFPVYLRPFCSYMSWTVECATLKVLSRLTFVVARWSGIHFRWATIFRGGVEENGARTCHMSDPFSQTLYVTISWPAQCLACTDVKPKECGHMVSEIRLHIVRLQEKSNSRISKSIRKTLLNLTKLVPKGVPTSCTFLAHMDTHTHTALYL